MFVDLVGCELCVEIDDFFCEVCVDIEECGGFDDRVEEGVDQLLIYGWVVGECVLFG